MTDDEETPRDLLESLVDNQQQRIERLETAVGLDEGGAAESEVPADD